MKIRLGRAPIPPIRIPPNSGQSRRELLRKAVGLPAAAFVRSVAGDQSDALPWDRPEPWRNQVPPEYYGDPIFLYGACVVSPGADAAPPLKLLRNPNPGPMEIHEIRFRLVSPYSTSNLATVTGAVITCKLALGEFDLTNGYVPVNLFDGSDHFLTTESLYQPAGAPAPALGLAQASYFADYTWRLATPIWVPQGATLACAFQHKGQIASSVRVRIGYSGKSFPLGTPAPRRMVLPYVAAYSSKMFDTQSGNADRETSSELDLMNGSDSQLTLAKMVGRQTVISNSNGNYLALNTELAENNIAPSGPNGGDMAVALNVSMISSSGFPIIKNQTPIRLAFDAMTRTLSTPGVTMEPGDFYLATIEVPALTGARTGAMESALSTQAQVGISIVGYREIG